MKRRYVVWTCLLIVSLIITSLGWINPVNVQESPEGNSAPIVLQHTPGPGQEMLLDQPIEIRVTPLEQKHAFAPVAVETALQRYVDSL